MTETELRSAIEALDLPDAGEDWGADDWMEVFRLSSEVAPVDIESVSHFWATSSGFGPCSDQELVAVFKLRDGRYASVHAGNDCTGWGCQGDYVDWRIADTYQEIVEQGLTKSDRVTFNVSLEHEL